MGAVRTGKYQPKGNRWPGVFIEGDSAMWYAECLQKWRDGKLSAKPATIILDEIIALLESCHVGS